MKWEPGRQKGVNRKDRTPLEYEKFKIYQFRIWKFIFDCYILHYPPMFSLPLHKDKVDGKHWRMNITLKGHCHFVIQQGKLGYSTWKIHIFRPDLYNHGLFTRTETFKLSFGFVKLC